MAAIQRDQFRTNPLIALETAYAVASNFSVSDLKSRQRHEPADPEAEQSVTYNVYWDDEFTDPQTLSTSEDPSEVSYELVEDGDPRDIHNVRSKYQNTSDWRQFHQDSYGTPPFPHRQVTISWGDSPFIEIEVTLDREIKDLKPPMNPHYQDKTRQFVPVTYDGPALPQFRINLNHLKEWFRQFVPRDPLEIKSLPNLSAVAGDGVCEDLAEDFIAFYEDLPPTKDDIEREHHPFQRQVCLPTYCANFLDVSLRAFDKQIRPLLCDDGPFVEVWGNEEKRFSDHLPFDGKYYSALGHERFWDDGQVYDWSARYVQSTKALHTSPWKRRPAI